MQTWALGKRLRAAVASNLDISFLAVQPFHCTKFVDWFVLLHCAQRSESKCLNSKAAAFAWTNQRMANTQCTRCVFILLSIKGNKINGLSRSTFILEFLFVSFLCSINVSTCVPLPSLSHSRSTHFFDFISYCMVAITILDKTNPNWLAATAKCNELLPVQCGDDQHIHSSNLASLILQFYMLFVSSHKQHIWWTGCASSATASPTGLSSDCWRLCLPLLICFVTFRRRGLFKMREVVITAGWEARAQSSHLASIQHRLSHYNVRLFFFLSSVLALWKTINV